MRRTLFVAGALGTLAGIGCSAKQGNKVTILDVSYDPTRELYSSFNTAFARHGRRKPARMSRSAVGPVRPTVPPGAPAV